MLTASAINGGTPESPLEIYFERGIEFEGKLFFYGSVENDTVGDELYTYDSATGDVTLIKDINVGGVSSNIDHFTILGDKLYFTATSADVGSEIFVYDPTALEGAGDVYNVTDIRAEASGSLPKNYAVLDGKLYFNAFGTDLQKELYRYDPDTGQTTLAANIYAEGSSDPTFLTPLDGKLYFAAWDDDHKSQLWVFDPTANAGAGEATRVSEINSSGNDGFSVTEITLLNDKLYFAADDGTVGKEIWEFDPASGVDGTLTRRTGISGTGNTFPNSLAVFNGELFFQAFRNDVGAELWSYNSTTHAVTLIDDLNEGLPNSTPTDLTPLNGSLFFAAFTPLTGSEVWQYDPTANNGAGSITAFDVDPGVSSGFPAYLVTVGNHLYFSSFNGAGTRIMYGVEVSSPITAEDDSYETDEDTALTVSAAGVLTNDVGSSLTASVVTDVQHGTLTLNPDGSFTYDPDDDYFGTDQFTYQASDGSGFTATATVLLTITSQPDSAIIGGTITGTIGEDDTSAIGGTLTITDADPGEASFVAQASTTSSFGEFSVNAAGAWSYTLDNAAAQSLNANETATDLFTVLSVDGTPQLISITITGSTDSPVASIDSISAARYVGNAIDVTASATDVDTPNSSLTFSYEVFLDQEMTPFASDSGTALTNFQFTPSVAGAYRIVLTVTDGDGKTHTVQQSINVTTSSVLELKFENNLGTAGEVDNSGSSPQATFNEWQDATAELWITIAGDIPAAPFDLTFQFASTSSWFIDPVLLDSVGDGATWSTESGTTTATLQNVDLTEHQPGDRVLLATIQFPKNAEDVVGVPMNASGQYPTASTDHGVELLSGGVDGTEQAFSTMEDVTGRFIPVVYDLNDDGKVSLADFGLFVQAFNLTPSEQFPHAYGSDFNLSGHVSLPDFGLFVIHFGFYKGGPQNVYDIRGFDEPAQAATFSLLEGESIAPPASLPRTTMAAAPVTDAAASVDNAVTEPSVLYPPFTSPSPSTTPAEESTLPLEYPEESAEPWAISTSFDPRFIDAAWENEEDFADPADIAQWDEEVELEPVWSL